MSVESFASPAASTQPDVRAKLTTKGFNALEAVFPGALAGPMQILKRDRGVVFPYVPTIMMSHQANYGTHQPIHSNFVYKYFQNMLIILGHIRHF